MPQHANKNVHKLWKEGRILFICDTGVSMYDNSPHEQGSNGAWRPATVKVTRRRHLPAVPTILQNPTHHKKHQHVRLHSQ